MILFRSALLLAALTSGTGCFFQFDELAATDAIACTGDREGECPPDWSCSPRHKRCFFGGIPALAAVEVTPTDGITTGESGTFTTDSISVRLVTAPSETVRIPVVTSDPGEAVPATDLLEFTPTTWGDVQVVKLDGVQDDEVDGMVGYEVIVGPPRTADGDYGALPAVIVSAANADDDVAGFSIFPTSLTTSEAGTTRSFEVTLTSRPSAEVVIPVTVDRADEAMLSATEVRISPDDWNRPARVDVTGRNEPDAGVADGPQPYIVTVGPVSSQDPNYALLAAKTVNGVNDDDDTPGFVVTAPSTLNVTEGGATATFQLRLTTRPQNAALVAVALSTTRPAEAAVSPATLVFDGGNWNGNRLVTVTGRDDSDAGSVVDGDQVFLVFMTSASSDPGYASRDAGTVDGINRDNDTPALIVTDGGVSLQPRERETMQITTMRLANRPLQDVMVDLALTTTAAGTITPSSVLTFTPANWSTPQAVGFTAADDDVREVPDQLISMTINTRSLHAAYRGLAVNDIGIRIRDDERLVKAYAANGNWGGAINASSWDNNCENRAGPSDNSNWRAMIHHTTAGQPFLAGFNYIRSEGAVNGPVIGRANSSGFLDFPLTNPLTDPALWPRYWTGLNASWASSGSACLNWSQASTSYSGSTGIAVVDSRAIAEGGAPPTCNTTLAVVCVEK